MEASIAVTREQLYEEVWSTPVSQLAQKYGLSDRGLGKMCERHNVPRPGRGYWARKQAGQNPRQPALPPAGEGKSATIVFQPASSRPERSTYRPPDPPPPPPISKEAQRLLDAQADGPAIVVPGRLCRPHPLIASVAAEQAHLTAEARRLRYNPDWLKHQRELAPNIMEDLRFCAPGLRERALRVMDTLFKALEAQGHEVRCDVRRRDREVETWVAGMKFWLLAKAVSFSRSGSPRKRLPLHDEPLENGMMIRAAWSYDGKKHVSVSDDRGVRIEDRLGELIAAMIRAADADRHEREQQSRRYEESRAEDLNRAEAEAAVRQKQAEEARDRERVEWLLAQVRDWKTSRDIRSLLRAVQRSHGRAGRAIGQDSELGRWMEWANGVADRTDPLGPTPRRKNGGADQAGANRKPV